VSDESVRRLVNLEQLEARILERFNVRLTAKAREELANYEVVTGLLRKYAEARDWYRDILISKPENAEQALGSLVEMARTLAPLLVPGRLENGSKGEA
jgi:hypothetical protein